MRRRRLRVEWLESARLDLEGIAEHLHAEAPLRAARLLDALVDRGESLRDFPERGRVVPELREVGEDAWREVQEPPWRLVYRLAGDVVEVHAVLDSRRSLEDLLRERLLRPT